VGALQKPDATHVAGYRTWTSLGRFVRRGEKGIFILAPMVCNKRKKDETEQATDAKETQRPLYGFRGVYVFDTQTEGADLSEFEHQITMDVGEPRAPIYLLSG
jgi:antirestriction protein ArdC